MVATYGLNPLLVALGALIVIVADVIFVIFGPYGYSSIVWAAAAVALVTVLFRARLPAAIAANYQALIFGAVGVAVLVTLREIVDDLEFLTTSSPSVGWLLGALAIYAGVVIMAFGAWRLWNSSPA